MRQNGGAGGGTGVGVKLRQGGPDFDPPAAASDGPDVKPTQSWSRNKHTRRNRRDKTEKKSMHEKTMHGTVRHAIK